MDVNAKISMNVYENMNVNTENEHEQEWLLSATVPKSNISCMKVYIWWQT